jgi:DNA-binding transcriptional regulator YiaG
MTADQFRYALARVGLSQSAAARLFGISDRTIRHWTTDTPIPYPVVILMRLLTTRRISIDDIEQINKREMKD